MGWGPAARAKAASGEARQALGTGRGALKRAAGASETVGCGRKRPDASTASFRDGLRGPRLIISCEQCRAQFRLDDSKIPEGGARVRCSKCNHAFFIAPPGQADDLEAEKLAREALQGVRAEAEEPESDWQFNEGAPASPPPPASGLKAARDAVDELLGDLVRSASARPARVAPLPPAPEPELAPELPAESEPEPSPFEAAPEPVARPESGSPQGWNFLEDAEEPEVDEPSAIGQLPLMPRWKLLEQEREEAERAIEARAAEADLDEGASSFLRRWLGRLAAGAGWIACIGLLAAGARGLATGPPPVFAAQAAVLETAGFRAEDVRARWVENAVGGPLLVVSGRLGPAAGTGGAEGPLAVRLLDARGEPLPAAAPVGPPFPERALRERSPAELRTSQERAAPDFARLHPGESVPFQALFAEVPAAAARLALERLAP